MWADRIEQTKQMRRKHLEGGGPERIRRQREKGKMTAWERIEYLLDDGSFHPVDSFFQTREDSASLLQGKTYLGDGVITGWGTIHGRSVCVASEDFTVIGGTLGEVHAQKICRDSSDCGDSGTVFRRCQLFPGAVRFRVYGEGPEQDVSDRACRRRVGAGTEGHA